MKALVMVGPEKVEMRDLPMPVPGKGQVLVRNCACAVCNATDTKIFSGKHSLAVFPCFFGHEGAGVVEAIGAGIDTVKPGLRVLGAGYPKTETIGSFWGMYAEYGIANEKDIIAIPDGISYEHATIAHMLAEALNAIQIALLGTAEHVVIIGCGAVGLSLLTVIEHMYPQSIIMIDIADEKLAMAKRLGATHTINTTTQDAAERIREITNGQGSRFVFEAVGVPATYDLAFDLVNPGGIIIPFGLVEGTLPLPFRKLYAKQAQLRFVRAAGSHEKQNKQVILNMMRRRQIQPERLITSRFALKDFKSAVAAIKEGNQNRVIMEICSRET